MQTTCFPPFTHDALTSNLFTIFSLQLGWLISHLKQTAPGFIWKQTDTSVFLAIACVVHTRVWMSFHNPPKHIGLFENMNQALFKPDQRTLLGIQTQMSPLWLWSKIYACVLMKHYACVMTSLLLKNDSKGIFCFKPSSMVSCDHNPVILFLHLINQTF